MLIRRAWLFLLLCAPAAAVETSLPSVELPRLPAAAVPAIPAAAPRTPLAAPLPRSIQAPEAAAPRQAAPAAAIRQAARAEHGIAAKPQAAQARLDSLFDERNAAQDEPPAPVVRPRNDPDAPPPNLLDKARPWRTQTQLARLNAEAPRASGERFTFSVIGDAEPGRFWIWRALFNHRGVFAKILAAAGRTKSDFIVQLGDMVSRGSAKNYDKFFDLMADVNPLKPYLTVIGNHDRRRPHGVTDSRMYSALFGSTNYYYERGGVRFVVLDSSAGRLTPAQLSWLDQTLDTPLRKIVLTHMPPTVLKAWTRVPHMPMAGGFKKGAREFTQIVSRRNVERVYMGHVHGFGVLDYKGVRYVLTGGGGSPLFPSNVHERFHHFITVEVAPNGLVETVHKENGTTFQIPAAARP